MYTSKSLISASIHIDPKKAERLAFERYTIPSWGSCTNPASLNHDQYGRMASQETLTTNTQGGSCNTSSPIVNLQNFLIRENNVDRPYIYVSMDNEGSAYDTMGVGRVMQKTYTGGLENNVGGWERINMDRNPKSNMGANQALCAPRQFRGYVDPNIPKSMSTAMNSVYNS